MNRSILVVDDDTAILDFVSMALQNEGYKVNIAHNGAAALQAIEEHQPDLVLLDMAMPVMDGWAFMRAYCDESSEHAPIITLSAHANFPAKMLCSSDFIAKPFDLDHLLALVERRLQQSTSQTH